MKFIKKLILAVITVAVVISLAIYAYQTISAEQAYMKKVVKLVDHSDSRWYLNVDLPATPERLQWDAEYLMPRVMFLGKRRPEDRSRSLWSMNINATDLKLMISSDEIKNMSMRELTVSPDGRYLFANSQPWAFQYKCYLYDLKEQTKTYISEDACTGVHWTGDGHDAILTNGYGPAVFTMADKKLQRVNELMGYDEFSGINTGRGSFLSHDGSKYIIATTEKANFFYDGDSFMSRNGKGDFLVYDANTFELLEKTDYFPKGCDSFTNYSVDRTYFTCSKNKSFNKSRDEITYSVYSAIPPFKLVAQTPEVSVVQFNTLYSNLVSKLFRDRKADEDSPVERVMYWYKYNNTAPNTSTLMYHYFYLSPNLRENYNQRDFTSFFPPLPTQAQFDEAKRRIQEGK